MWTGARRREDTTSAITDRKIGYFVALLEELGCTAAGEMLPMQPGGVMKTTADVSDLMHDVGFTTETSIEDGIRDFVAWFRDYYKR
jgi:UDP-glucuronate 4-epimerase